MNPNLSTCPYCKGQLNREYKRKAKCQKCGETFLKSTQNSIQKLVTSEQLFLINITKSIWGEMVRFGSEGEDTYTDTTFGNQQAFSSPEEVLDFLTIKLQEFQKAKKIKTVSHAHFQLRSYYEYTQDYKNATKHNILCWAYDYIGMLQEWKEAEMGNSYIRENKKLHGGLFVNHCSRDFPRYAIPVENAEKILRTLNRNITTCNFKSIETVVTNSLRQLVHCRSFGFL